MARYYKYQGKDLPSVTTITGQLDKPALTAWAANAACDCILDEIGKLSFPLVAPQTLHSIIESARSNFRKVSRTALDIGSRVHAAVEEFLQSGRQPFRPEPAVLSAFTAFLEWKDAHQVKPIALENTVYGDGFAGTEDFYGWFDGKLYVVDWKSSKGIYPEMRYQVAAYRSTHEDAVGCGILRLDKETGLPEWKDTSETYESDLEVFNTLKALWWQTHKKGNDK